MRQWKKLKTRAFSELKKKTERTLYSVVTRVAEVTGKLLHEEPTKFGNGSVKKISAVTTVNVISLL